MSIAALIERGLAFCRSERNTCQGHQALPIRGGGELLQVFYGEEALENHRDLEVRRQPDISASALLLN